MHVTRIDLDRLDDNRHLSLRRSAENSLLANHPEIYYLTSRQ